jgi:Glutamine cyclotransferase
MAAVVVQCNIASNQQLSNKEWCVATSQASAPPLSSARLSSWETHRAEGVKVLGKLDLSNVAASSQRSMEPDDVLNGIAFHEQTGRIVVTGKR